MDGNIMMKRPTIRGRGGRRGSILQTASAFSDAVAADGQLKAELNTIKKKYERLDKKEKRIQVHV